MLTGQVTTRRGDPRRASCSSLANPVCSCFSCRKPPASSPSSHPSTSFAFFVVDAIVLKRGFPITRCSSRVRLLRHMSWRVSDLIASGDFRLYWLSSCRLALNLYILCLCFGAVSCVRRAAGVEIRTQWASLIRLQMTPLLTEYVVLILTFAHFLLLY